ncbi:3',5'-cyclic-AMP phosphodiesterase [Corallincola luteus]|uniref:3',5'-cyclic adenosine monophosphate phosphodiesterase CpdA n=3 Tax=Corallincola TaxID=1775176 RepID=A0A368NP64_9GAMM|nr:3',5'-cyclic-AMP phosphodiesterase [Corallincola holothuriorum]TAA47646.1 3',5'-cyclic-AMP phosphodiesterase [Corallincola spongiicola]TCI05629.1 3',5'-cyclic-AMP phosphodiesterase [Corallincola luteus]
MLPEGRVCPQLLQITDTHLFGSPEKSLLGVNTRDSFHAVLDLIEQQPAEIDAFLATGDISQDDSISSYSAFAHGIARFAAPCYWIPGNHDDPRIMATELDNPTLHAAKQIVYPKWQVLLLDSQVKKHTYGFLSESQLLFVEKAVAEYPDRHCLVLLHHNPIPVGCRWLDQHQLKNGSQFLDLLSRLPQVKGVVWGHVHQTLDRMHNGIRLLSTPSTCIQFKPNCDQFTLDTVAPGYRRLTLLDDGEIDTEVLRLKDNPFAPNLASKGY